MHGSGPWDNNLQTVCSLPTMKYGERLTAGCLSQFDVVQLYGVVQLYNLYITIQLYNFTTLDCMVEQQ